MIELPSWFRSELAAQVTANLYKKTRETFSDELTDIGNHHAVLSGTGNPAFYFKGNIYTAGKYLKGSRPAMLVASLKPKMEDYVYRRELVNKEMAAVGNFLATTAMLCYSKDDAKILLPECVHEFMAEAPNTDEAVRITKDFGAEYQSKHTHIISVIKARLMTNLIL